MHGRIHVAEIPFISGNLAIGVQVIFPQHQGELFFGKIGVNDADGQHVKGQIPGGIPGIFPLVGHGDNVIVQHVVPIAIPHAMPLGGTHPRRDLMLL